MRVIIVLGGNDEFSSIYKRSDTDFIIGVDGGIYSIKKAKANIALAIGDFDTASINDAYSLTNNVIKLNPLKDASDLDFAIEEVRKIENVDQIIIYNFEGGRMDHYQAIINTLLRNSDLPIILKSIHNEIFTCNGERVVEKNDYKYISFFAPAKSCRISLLGFKFPLESHILSCFDNLCLSNEIDTKGIIKTDNLLLVIRSNDR